MNRKNKYTSEHFKFRGVFFIRCQKHLALLSIISLIKEVGNFAKYFRGNNKSVFWREKTVPRARAFITMSRLEIIQLNVELILEYVVLLRKKK